MASVVDLETSLRAEGARVLTHPTLGLCTRWSNVVRPRTSFTREQVLALLDLGPQMGGMVYTTFKRQKGRFVPLTEIVRMIDDETVFRSRLSIK